MGYFILGDSIKIIEVDSLCNALNVNVLVNDNKNLILYYSFIYLLIHTISDHIHLLTLLKKCFNFWRKYIVGEILKIITAIVSRGETLQITYISI